MLTTLTLLLFMTTCPMHAKHMAEVDSRHDTFGMHHKESRHNFRLYADGGAIELRGVAVDAIRKHLREIQSDFSKANFDTPRFVHDKVPDGVDVMKRLRAKIAYRYDDVAEGGRIRIRTSDPEAVRAIHAFMKFQIDEHRTGDTGVLETE